MVPVVAEKQKQECVYQEKQRECELRQKTLNLLPDSGANINKLQELIDQQAKTLLRLGAQWEQRRAGLVSRYREARQCQTNKANWQRISGIMWYRPATHVCCECSQMYNTNMKLSRRSIQRSLPTIYHLYRSRSLDWSMNKTKLLAHDLINSKATESTMTSVLSSEWDWFGRWVEILSVVRLAIYLNDFSAHMTIGRMNCPNQIVYEELMSRCFVVHDYNTESARQLETARQTRERLREMKEELATKEALQARLQEEHDKLSKTVSRTAYTRRILEIIGNIKKQKEDIDKIVEDTKQLQRDINIVSDRVDRSFTYADEIVFRDCAKENSSRKIYKLLIQLHSDCEQVVAMIEETGAIVREIRDLEEQIEVERAKDTASKLERISADLRQMKQESASLRAQLARAGEPS
ncbi:Coiled-coil domain-containing protein 22 [Homalodisca vitripennis]|nr:Coiled-coil domain-containing protein 22 [Homalodisca vitripennis]